MTYHHLLVLVIGIVLASVFFLPSTAPAQLKELPDAALNDTSALRQRLLGGLDPDEEEDDGTTLLMRAVERGMFDAAALLIEFEADVNASNDEGITPLMMAVMSGDNRIVQLLVERGANGSARDDVYRKTPLMLAVERGDSTAFRILMNDGSTDPNKTNERRESGLFVSAYFDNPSIAEDLLKAGVDVDEPDVFGRTPLMIASHYGNIHVVRLLLQHGADPDAQTRWSMRTISGGYKIGPWRTGVSALMYAASRGQAGVIRLLLDHGATADFTDEDLTTRRMNLTALDRAMASKDQSSILLLINAGNGEPHAPPTLDESGPPKHLQPLIPPRVVKDSSSVYHDAKRTGITHTVTVRVWVDDKGIPRRARAVRVSGTPVDREIMVERALDTIMFFRFSPGRDATGPVDCWTLIDVKLEPWTPVVIRE